MKSKKFLLLTLLLLLTSSFGLVHAKTNLHQSLLGKYGPTKNEFLNLCGSLINHSGKNSSKDKVCLIYFIGLRNGYLTAVTKTMDKAALYYALDGNVVPGSELKSSNWNKAFGSKAYAALEKNGVKCVKSIAPEKLLSEFYGFLKSITRDIGAGVLFDEFIQKKYAGQCS